MAGSIGDDNIPNERGTIYMKQRKKGPDLFQHAGEGQLEREAPLAARMRPYASPLFPPFYKGGLFLPPVHGGEHWG